jgi:hypothetical protein
VYQSQWINSPGYKTSKLSENAVQLRWGLCDAGDGISGDLYVYYTENIASSLLSFNDQEGR